MSMRSTLLVMTVVATNLSAVNAVQESVSMKQQARERGGSFTNVVSVTGPALPMEYMVRASDLILRGRITGTNTRLSDDESTVYTEYTITPIRILKRPAELGVSEIPVATAPIILQRVGGTLVVDGLRLETQTDMHDPDKPLSKEGEYVFFLTKATPSSMTTKRVRSGVFELASGQYAVFAIRDGKLSAFTKAAGARRKLTTDDPEVFLSSVQRMIDKPKQ